MSSQIAVRIPVRELEELDRAVAEGEYESRAAAVRAALQLLLRRRRNARISASYRDAYTQHRDGAEVGEAGALLAAEIVRSDAAESAD